MSFEEVNEVKFFKIINCILLFIFKKSFPNLRWQGFVFFFSCAAFQKFRVFFLQFKLIDIFSYYFSLLWENGLHLFIYSSIDLFFHVNIQLFQDRLLKTLFFNPLNYHDTFVKNQITMNVRVYSGFSVLLHHLYASTILLVITAL